MDFSSPDKSYSGPIKILKTPDSAKKIDRRRMYKCSPRLFQSFRDKCIIELKNRRTERRRQMFDRLSQACYDREESLKDSIIKEVMENVWNKMNYTGEINNKEIIENISLEHENYMKDLMEKELLLWESDNENYIEEMIENQYSISCMACLRHNLQIEITKDTQQTQIWCQGGCGFCLMLNKTTTEEELHNLINGNLYEHSKNCNEMIQFEFIHQKSLTNWNYYENIRFHCNICNYNRLLI